MALKSKGGGSEVLLSQFGRRLRDESDFPSSSSPPTLGFVESDVNTVCSSAPILAGAIWKERVGC